MISEQQLRTLFEPADPARGQAVPPPSATAAQVMARAGTAASAARARTAATPRAVLPARRLVLAGGAALLAAAVTAAVLPKRAGPGGEAARPPDTVPMGQVIVPIGYQFDTHPQPAAPHLRALAARIADAPYDTRSGRYAYRHGKSWNASRIGDEDLEAGFVDEEWMWTAADGSGRNHRKVVGVQFPNEASRRYWEPKLRAQPGYWYVPDQDDIIPPARPPGPTPGVDEPPPSGENPDPAERVRPADPTRPPTSRADIAKLLRAEFGAEHAQKWTMELYRSYVVPRQVRAQVLLILADLKGFVWRGEATDRAGRKGVAISVTWTPPPDNTDHNRYESAMIFDPRTGALLATETTVLTPHRRPDYYHLILEPGWTDQLS